MNQQSRNRAVIATLAFAGMVASFMQTILIPIQGQLPDLLHASREDTAWVITITLLVSAICTPISGRLGDMYGKRRVIVVLLMALITGSVIAALSPAVVPLIIGRALQGVGMGVIPLGISVLRDVIDEDHLGSAIALVSATLGVGGALGLPVSAAVTGNADWHVLFWLAAGLGALALALVVRFVPDSSERAGGRVDVPGVIGLSLGLAAVLIAVSRGNEWGWSSPLTWGLLGGGVLVLLLWGWIELRAGDPLVDLRVSARASVLLTNIASIAMGFALFSSQIAFPQLLELPHAVGGMGLSLLQASLVLMPAGLAMLAMSPVAGRVERRWGPKPLLVAGAAVIAVDYLCAWLLELSTPLVLAINLLIGLGIGLGYAAMPALIMRAVPADETGAANGLNTLMRSLGTAVASALVAAVLASSATVVDGHAVPSAEAFRLAFALGLGAAAVCCVIAVFIPKAATRD